MTRSRRPTRRDLLIVIGRLQSMIGHARGLHGNDRSQTSFARAQAVLGVAHELCIAALGEDPPMDGEHPRSAVICDAVDTADVACRRTETEA
mgnify:FL=1